MLADGSECVTDLDGLRGQERLFGPDYLLSGLLRRAHCKKAYLGTAAHGRSRRYRYYTCFTRNRYDTTACPAERIPADLLETAILAAALEFYSRHDLFDQAITAHAATIDTNHDKHHAELAAITKKITEKEAAVERYLHSFEAGTMPETVCGPRVESWPPNYSHYATADTNYTP